MCPEHGNEPIDECETIYRRVPVSKDWYSGGGLSPEAFAARDDDDTGLSVFRSKYKLIEQAGIGPSKKGYYVACLPVSELRAAGIIIEPRPLPDDPGHAEFPQLTRHNRDTPETWSLMHQLAEIGHRDVRGPYRTIDPLT